MHAWTTSIGLADMGFSISFLLFAAGFLGGMLAFIVVQALEHRYSELFFNPDAVNFAVQRIEQRQQSHPIEVELEAMERQE